jgi:hypothetical protein
MDLSYISKIPVCDHLKFRIPVRVVELRDRSPRGSDERTHDGEEDGAFVPACFDGAAEGGGKRVERRVLELVETFGL